MNGHTNPEDPEVLEERLRSMILGNVRITPDSSRERPPRGSTVPRRGQEWKSQSQERGFSPSNQHHSQQREHQAQRGSSGRPDNRTMTPTRAGFNAGDMNRGRGDQFASPNARASPRGRGQLWNPQMRPPAYPTQADYNAQCEMLELIAAQQLPHLELTQQEFENKDRFRRRLEQAFQQIMHSSLLVSTPMVNLVAFGSLSSGFGIPGSDMDLAIVTSSSQPDLGLMRLFEKTILDMGHGAHLLTRTRVPIIKVCQAPTPELYSALCDERQKWDDMTPDERERYDRPVQNDDETPGQQATKEVIDSQNASKDGESVTPQADANNTKDAQKSNSIETSIVSEAIDHKNNNTAVQQPTSAVQSQTQSTENASNVRPKKTWYREKRPGPLDFPKDGIGIQCDINAHNPLGLHNTLLLRCYSHCDVRVRLMVLFVKAWASRRKVNNSRHGTLSSYGYVLMVLHYLVNVAQPAVCPNLQLVTRPHDTHLSPHDFCEGYDIHFWKSESEIQSAARAGRLTQNREPLGSLLRGFFHYYAQQGHAVPLGGFSWTTQALSLRTPGGLVSKDAKGWTGARTVVQDNREVRNRYLCAIEDPFELDHNVARTVTHNGIVAIRDEFRRAWRIITRATLGVSPDGELFDEIVDAQPPPLPPPPPSVQPTEVPLEAPRGASPSPLAPPSQMEPVGLSEDTKEKRWMDKDLEFSSIPPERMDLPRVDPFDN